MRPLDHPAGEDYPATGNPLADALRAAVGAVERGVAQRAEQPATSSRWPECGAVGYVETAVGMAQVYCDKPVGHDGGTATLHTIPENAAAMRRHRAILEWDDEPAAPPIPEALCGVGGCVFTPHPENSAHSWYQPESIETDPLYGDKPWTAAEDEDADGDLNAARCGAAVFGELGKVQHCRYLAGHVGPRHSWSPPHAPAPNPTLCPECLAGKHGNCDGGSWDYMSDQATACACDH